MFSSVSCFSYFTSSEIIPSTHSIGGWKGPTADLDVVEGGQGDSLCSYW